MSLLGSITGSDAQRKGGAMSAKLAALNASFIGQEYTENIRKLEKTQDQMMGQARASIGASGISKEGTNQQYLNEMEKQFKGEKDWMKKAKDSQQKIARYGGAVSQQTANANAAASDMGGILTIASFFA